MIQAALFGNTQPTPALRMYRPFLTASENGKGVMDVDTVKGCTLGMAAYPDGGCYGECYAQKTAARYGIDFSVSVSRKPTRSTFANVFLAVQRHSAAWYRVGTAGDPCHDWENTVAVCEGLRDTGKVPVIITKHWIGLTKDQLAKLARLSAIVNTSTSGLDTDAEIAYRVGQMRRLTDAGVRSVCRVVTCHYGSSEWAQSCNEKQSFLLSLRPVVDNPLRASANNPRVASGDILLTRQRQAIGGGKMVSLHCDKVYLGVCQCCPDQCGVDLRGLAHNSKEGGGIMLDQMALFEKKIEFEYVSSVIGSGYEQQVAKLAIEDKIACRAARKNMQIHSAIIMKVDGEFSGFFTFQVNDVCKEFCLLQSVIEPEHYEPELYRRMVVAVIEQNTKGYPAIITTDPKSKFETPALFEGLGFETYLKMSGFCYMVKGDLADVRIKLLAHITMTNVWNSIKGDWLRLKREWNEKIEDAGEKHGVPDPKFASRGGCWQGNNGYSNVVLTKRTIVDGAVQVDSKKSLNGNASVLDPVACEVILRFFTRKNARRIYNPFGGGVQFGFVAGSYGYEYIASEIRQNQCDCNNKICADLDSAKWIQSDSATYHPDGMFDLVFSCPPYYKVETYLDYDGNPPPSEINSLDTYEKFRDVLFQGYEIAIEHMNDNSFFVVMTGDSRDKTGAYYCSESETELFFKSRGMSIYNKIIYLECEFTRLAHAKRTLNHRKFPKREQKIIVAYKGDIGAIKDFYQPIGRL